MNVSIKYFRLFCLKGNAFSHYKNICTSKSLGGKDYYAILGVNKDADEKEIRSAYLEKVKKLHPDLLKKDSEEIREITEAHKVLGKKESREEYDSTYDKKRFESTFYGNYSVTQHENSLSPLLNKFRPASPYSTREINLRIKFRVALKGVTKLHKIKVHDTCPTCDGNMSAPGTTSEMCPGCLGTGLENNSKNMLHIHQICKICFGKKVLIKTPCPDCKGKGSYKQVKYTQITIPPGAYTGQTISGKILNKDVYFVLNVGESETFVRKGDDIYTKETISFSKAFYGGTIVILGLKNHHKIDIPKGTKGNTTIRLIGKGFPRKNGTGNGDHYVKLNLETPHLKTKPQAYDYLSQLKEYGILNKKN